MASYERPPAECKGSPVRAHQALNLAATDAEGDPVGGSEVAELFCEPLRLDGRDPVQALRPGSSGQRRAQDKWGGAQGGSVGSYQRTTRLISAALLTISSLQPAQ